MISSMFYHPSFYFHTFSCCLYGSAEQVPPLFGVFGAPYVHLRLQDFGDLADFGTKRCSRLIPISGDDAGPSLIHVV